jgi:DNA-directed RNA polymerase subunit N (RpoN/RPB10)
MSLVARCWSGGHTVLHNWSHFFAQVTVSIDRCEALGGLLMTSWGCSLLSSRCLMAAVLMTNNDSSWYVGIDCPYLVCWCLQDRRQLASAIASMQQH